MPDTSTRERHPLRRAVSVAYVVAWCGVIFWFSHQPNLRVSEHDLLDLVLRKSAHVAVFAMLALLVWRALTIAAGVRSTAGRAAGALVLTVAYACSDEWHQSFVAGRVGHLQDVLVDTVGAALAVSLLLVLARRTNLREEP